MLTVLKVRCMWLDYSAGARLQLHKRRAREGGREASADCLSANHRAAIVGERIIFILLHIASNDLHSVFMCSTTSVPNFDLALCASHWVLRIFAKRFFCVEILQSSTEFYGFVFVDSVHGGGYVMKVVLY